MVLLDMRDEPALPRERVGAEAARERALGCVLARVSQQAVYAMAVCDSRNRGNAAWLMPPFSLSTNLIARKQARIDGSEVAGGMPWCFPRRRLEPALRRIYRTALPRAAWRWLLVDAT